MRDQRSTAELQHPGLVGPGQEPAALAGAWTLLTRPELGIMSVMHTGLTERAAVQLVVAAHQRGLGAETDYGPHGLVSVRLTAAEYTAAEDPVTIAASSPDAGPSAWTRLWTSIQRAVGSAERKE